MIRKSLCSCNSNRSLKWDMIKNSLCTHMPRWLTWLVCVCHVIMTLITTFLEPIVPWTVSSLDHEKYICVLTGAQGLLNHPVLK
jgi:hypothetical protein